MEGISPQYILSRTKELRDYTVAFLSRLIKTPSLSGREEQVVRLLEEEFEKAGAEEVRVDGLGNVMARLGSRGTTVAFDAHIDTVDVGEKRLWNFDPFSGEVTATRVLGRGAADQKGGMASMMTALRILAEARVSLPFTLLFVGSVQEEDCDGLCWHYIIDREKVAPDFVILTEPSEGKIARGQRGRMEIEIKVAGVSCHGSAPERGENAIYKLAPIITALERLNERLPLDPFLGKGTLSATRVRSNSPSLCAVADAADVYVDRRLTAGETPEGAVAELSALPEVRGAGATVEIPVYNTLSWRGVAYPRPKTYPAWTLEASHPLVTHAVHCYERLFGTRPTVDKWVFSTNGVATMGEFGIPTIGFGPGEERMAHAPNESVPIEDLLRCAAFYCYLPWVIAGR